MLKIFEHKEGESVVKGTPDNVAATLKALNKDVDVAVTDGKFKVTEDMIKGAKEWAGKKDLLAALEESKKNNGKVAKDTVENLLSKGSQPVQDAFAKIAKEFGTSWKKWGAIGLAAGLVVGWAASKFFGSKENA